MGFEEVDLSANEKIKFYEKNIGEYITEINTLKDRITELEGALSWILNLESNCSVNVVQRHIISKLLTKPTEGSDA